MKKICIVSATRAEYGLLRWTIDGVAKDPALELQLVVTGTHLEPEAGETWRQIAADGYPIAARVPMGLEASQSGIVRSMSRCANGMADALEKLRPDLLLVLGDRYELLPICSTALVMGVPIAHIAGGEHTHGAIDEQVRYAVSMMASLHFPNSEAAAAELRRMLGPEAPIFNVGEPCLENNRRLELLSREEAAAQLGLDADKPWILATLHPETRLDAAANQEMARALLQALLEREDAEIIMSEANADYGGAAMNELYRSSRGHAHFHLIPSLGQLLYLSLMQEAFCVIGNSSSAVIETPVLGIPAINIGDRQKGRPLSPNVTSCTRDYASIKAALGAVGGRFAPDFSAGDGYCSQHIIEHLKTWLHGL